MKVPREFSRRARTMDFSVLKAQEYRNYLIFYFPLILQCIESSARERKLWLLLTFMIRSCIIPEEEFSAVNARDIEMCSSDFYSLFENLFGTRNCSYNVHIISSHLLKMRSKGPLTKTSAFCFENFYGEVRNSFVPGTQSTLKQILQTVLIKKFLVKHYCSPITIISENDTALECNSLIYTYIDGNYKIYQVISQSEEIYNCHTMGKLPVSFKELPLINWSSIGVFRKGGLSNTIKAVSKSDFKGKVLKISNFLITCPINILDEK